MNLLWRSRWEFFLYTDVISMHDAPEEGKHPRAGDVGAVVERDDDAERETGHSVEFLTCSAIRSPLPRSGQRVVSARRD